MQPVKLNIFQRGIFQKIVSIAVYFACVPTTILIVARIEKRRFADFVEEALQKGILAPENSHDLKELIAAMDKVDVLSMAVAGFFCAGIGWLLMRWTANFNWSWPVTLPQVVEFRSAMRRLNIMNPAEEIECVRRHKLSVFIASAPLSHDGKQEKVRARLYAFARHALFKNDVFERYIGKQTLCLDAGEYECVVEKIKKEEASRESVAIATQKEEIKGLQKAVVSLTLENKKLVQERDELSGKVRIQKAQEKGRVDRLRKERLLWAAYTPIIDKMIRDASAGKQYITPDIEAAFAEEWEKRTDLREHMRHLTGNEEAKTSTDLLKAVKKELKAVGIFRSSGGRSKKNP